MRLRGTNNSEGTGGMMRGGVFFEIPTQFEQVEELLLSVIDCA
jgi:hypothetical protein